MRTQYLLFGLLALTGLAGSQDADSRKTPARTAEDDRPLAARFADLEQRSRAREKAFEEQLHAANRLEPAARSQKITDENESFQRDWHAAEAEVRALIRAHPTDPACLDGIILLPGLMRSYLDDDIVKIVREHFINDPRMGRLCQSLAYRHEDRSGDLLRDVAARTPIGPSAARRPTRWACGFAPCPPGESPHERGRRRNPPRNPGDTRRRRSGASRTS